MEKGIERETGSLISIKKNVKDILIPSEERQIKMYPMDYEEFLWAIGDNATNSLIKKLYDMTRRSADKQKADAQFQAVYAGRRDAAGNK